jgi:hypothetical protein
VLDRIEYRGDGGLGGSCLNKEKEEEEKKTLSSHGISRRKMNAGRN